MSALAELTQQRIEVMSGEIAILQEEKEFLQAKLDAVRYIEIG